MWRIRSWIPFVAARQWRKLSDQMKYIYTSDWLMKQEGGVETLSSEALVEVNTSHYNPLQSLCSEVLSMYLHLVIV